MQPGRLLGLCAARHGAGAVHSKERARLPGSRRRFWDGSMDGWMDGSPLSTGRRSRKAPTSGRKGWERLGWHGMEGMVMARSEKNGSGRHISRELRKKNIQTL